VCGGGEAELAVNHLPEERPAEVAQALLPVLIGKR